jgi:hypothetical protein
MESRRHQYGFEWGPADICCGMADDKRGWVVLLVKTKQYPDGIQVYVTKSGKIRVHSKLGEWKVTPNVAPISGRPKDGPLDWLVGRHCPKRGENYEHEILAKHLRHTG